MVESPTSPRGQFGREFLSDLTNRLDGPAFLSRYLKVEKSGDRHRALCPFHKDSKPSMYIRDDGSFYCFGCHKKGSIFNFLMEQNGVNFPDAVKEVAQYLGVPVPERRGSGGPTKEQLALFDVLQKSALFFKRHLERAGSNTAIKQYLKSRGIDRAVIEKYQIGFAPNSWSNLKDHFADTDVRTLIDADVLVENRERNSIYDRYRNRLMFPIRNRQGNVVGFGGRTLDDDVEPKYLNTKQTKVFSKGRELYGLFEALNIARRPDKLLLVEGYMDVVALSQHGIPYAVAALGTASNDMHFRTMFWFTNEVICCFDGDDAGRTAAKRALESALAALTDEKTVKFMFLPEGEDPDSFVRAEGTATFEDAINNAQHVADYFVDSLLETKDRTFSSIEQKARFVDRAKSLIQGIKHDSFRTILAQEVARCFPNEVNMDQLLALNPIDQEPAEPQPFDGDFDEPVVEPENTAARSERYYSEINTRRRVSQLLCAPAIWVNLRDHRALLHQLVDVAQNDPLTRLWQAIDHHGFTDISGLISSFQDDTWFARYLADIYDATSENNMSNPQDTLDQFLNGVETFLTAKQRDVERQVQLELLSQSDHDDATQSQ
ncbi:MAG: DNA primase [Gammaproteobacteria bacterium]|nr:DNA primase [Gammaproteobacteria bacterium]